MRGAFDAHAYWVGGLVLAVGFLTLLSMGRTWADAYWAPATKGRDMMPAGWPLLATIAGLGLVTLAMTAWADPLYGLSVRAAEQLLQPELYVRAVLGTWDPASAGLGGGE